MSATKPYTLDITGLVLSIRTRVNQMNGRRYKVIEFDDSVIQVPEYVANRTHVGDSIHAWFESPFCTKEMDAIEQVGFHKGFWVIEHV